MTTTTLRPRDRDALIQSLRSGVTPRTGVRHIQVGRDAEIAALDKDLDRICDGGASFRLIVGEYGSGKAFFLNLLRGAAMEKHLVVAHADLNPGRRLHGSGGEARSLYAELMHNLASRTKPEGGLYSYPALQSRLAENPFARDGLIDLCGPVIPLDSLSRAQFAQLLGKLSQVYQGANAPLLPEAAIPAFIAHSEQRLGEATFRTPRTTIKAFVGLLAVLEQNETADWRVLLERTVVETEQAGGDVGDVLDSLVL